MTDAQPTPAEDVRRLLLNHHDATFCTVSADEQTAGIPFGSVVPFQLTAEGAPVVLISDIAQHTRNVLADPRASLLVREPGLEDDPQTGWRITLMGEMHRYVTGAPAHAIDRQVDEDWLARLHARYLAVVPKADKYLETHGFHYYGLTLRRVRYIGGFGRIHWVDAADVLRAPEVEGAARIVEHMNDDHADALQDYCEGFRGYRPERARMLAVDPAGFHVQAENPDKLEFFGFPEEIDGERARHAFVDLLKVARAKIPAPAQG